MNGAGEAAFPAEALPGASRGSGRPGGRVSGEGRAGTRATAGMELSGWAGEAWREAACGRGRRGRASLLQSQRDVFTKLESECGDEPSSASLMLQSHQVFQQD